MYRQVKQTNCITNYYILYNILCCVICINNLSGSNVYIMLFVLLMVN